MTNPNRESALPKAPLAKSLPQPGTPSPSALVSPAASRSAVNPRHIPRRAAQLRVQ